MALNLDYPSLSHSFRETSEEIARTKRRFGVAISPPIAFPVPPNYYVEKTH
jgi:hypothetical protein